MTTNKLFLTLLAAFSLLLGCSEGGNQPSIDSDVEVTDVQSSGKLTDDEVRFLTEQRKPINHCVLVDFSGVRAMKESREQYAENIGAALNNIGPGDRVSVCMITANSISQPAYLLSVELPPYKVERAKNEKTKLKEQRRFLEAHAQRVNEHIETLKNRVLTDNLESPSTDIVSAIHLAASLLGKYPDFEKELTIFSDMEENSAVATFTQSPPSEKETAKIIDNQEKSVQGLPNLTDTKVRVIGAQSPSQDAFFKIRYFWMEFFKRCGASLTESDYSAAI